MAPGFSFVKSSVDSDQRDPAALAQWAVVAALIAVLAFGSSGREARATDSVGENFAAGMAAARTGDFATALETWLPLAEAGHAAAQYNIALMYERGAGVAPDRAAAYRWYHAAANQGHGYGQYRVGLALQRGLGVEEDDTAAVAWFARAAEQLVPGAAYEIGYAHHEGEGTPRNLAVALRWFWVAARLGYSDAIPARNYTEREVSLDVATRALEEAEAWLAERER